MPKGSDSIYSNEIIHYLNDKHWILTTDEFYIMVNNSPQIIGYKLTSLNDNFYTIHFYTNDGLYGDVQIKNYDKLN